MLVAVSSPAHSLKCSRQDGGPLPPPPMCHLRIPPSSSTCPTRACWSQSCQPVQWQYDHSWGWACAIDGSLGLNIPSEKLCGKSPWFQVGKSDIPLFRPLSIYLRVQIDLGEDSTWWNLGPCPAGWASLHADCRASLGHWGAASGSVGRALGLRGSSCRLPISAPRVRGGPPSGHPLAGGSEPRPARAPATPQTVPNFSRRSPTFVLSASHPHCLLHHNFLQIKFKSIPFVLICVVRRYHA